MSRTGSSAWLIRRILRGLWMLYAAGALAFLVRDLMVGFTLGHAFMAALLWPVLHAGDILYWTVAAALEMLGVLNAMLGWRPAFG